MQIDRSFLQRWFARKKAKDKRREKMTEELHARLLNCNTWYQYHFIPAQLLSCHSETASLKTFQNNQINWGRGRERAQKWISQKSILILYGDFVLRFIRYAIFRHLSNGCCLRLDFVGVFITINEKIFLKSRHIILIFWHLKSFPWNLTFFFASSLHTAPWSYRKSIKWLMHFMWYL